MGRETPASPTARVSPPPSTWRIRSVYAQTHSPSTPLHGTMASFRSSDPLEALGEFEELLRKGEDAVMEAAADEVAGFVSHVWFVATALQELHQSTADTARLSIEATLAWQQLDEQTRERWRNVAELAVRRFEETPEHQ